MKSKKAQKAFNIIIIVLQAIVLLSILASFVIYGIIIVDAYNKSKIPADTSGIINIDLNDHTMGFLTVLFFSILINPCIAVFSLLPLILSLINIRSKARVVNLPVSITLFLSPFVLEGIILLFGLITGVIGK